MQDLFFREDHYSLSPSEVLVKISFDDHIVPECLELFYRFFRNTRFQRKTLGLSHRGCGEETWGLDGFVESHSELNDVDDDLGERGKDPRSPGGSQNQKRFFIPEHDEGAHRADGASVRPCRV